MDLLQETSAVTCTAHLKTVLAGCQVLATQPVSPKGFLTESPSVKKPVRVTNKKKSQCHYFFIVLKYLFVIFNHVLWTNSCSVTLFIFFHLWINES